MESVCFANSVMLRTSKSAVERLTSNKFDVCQRVAAVGLRLLTCPPQMPAFSPKMGVLFPFPLKYLHHGWPAVCLHFSKTIAAMGHIDGAEVAKHNSKKSCWIVLDSKAYDVTSFVSDHPGGAPIILRNAGSVSRENKLIRSHTNACLGCDRRIQEVPSTKLPERLPSIRCSTRPYRSKHLRSTSTTQE